MATLPRLWRLVPDPTRDPFCMGRTASRSHQGLATVLELAFDPKDATGIVAALLSSRQPPVVGGRGGSVKDEGMWLDSAVAVVIWLARLPLLLWHGIVELSVIEQQTTLRRNAGDVLVTMVPVDIAPGIDGARTELLGGAVIDAADVEH